MVVVSLLALSLVGCGNDYSNDYGEIGELDSVDEYGTMSDDKNIYTKSVLMSVQLIF